ncbi:RTX toxins and related Ca2+-binding proteins [Vibrio astriarenae]|nr:RTX toxins and related Ca2+-binding proteins [Vibrio sp. C7]
MAYVVQDDSAGAAITSMEDNTIDVLAKLFDGPDALLSVNVPSTQDAQNDQLTIVIDLNAVDSDGEKLIPEGSTISGAIFNYVDNVYVYQTTVNASDGTLNNLSGLTLTLPDDYAGDFELPVKIVTTDPASGDQNVSDFDIPVAVYPQVDVDASNQPTDTTSIPSFNATVVQTLGLDAQLQPTSVDSGTPVSDIAYEDGIIQLDLSYQLADSDASETEGRETLTEVTIAIDSSLGNFVDSQGNPIGVLDPNTNEMTLTLTSDIDVSLSSIFFKPAEDLPGSEIGSNLVNFSVSGKVQDRVEFEDSATASLFADEVASDNTKVDTEASISGAVVTVEKEFKDVAFSVDIVPVVDPVVVTGPINTDGDIEVTGNEDEWISLGNAGLSLSLGDLDGSEEFVSLKLTGVPDDFLVQSTDSNEFIVKNLGGGEWSIRVKDASETMPSFDNIEIKGAEQFGGTVELGLTTFVQEKLTGEIKGFDNKFTLNVQPIADDIDTDIIRDTVFTTEGVDTIIELGAILVDTEDSLPPATGDFVYEENQPEQVRITIDDVPEGASITIGTETQIQTAALEPLVFDIPQGVLSVDSLTFNSGDYNRDTNSWGERITISIQATEVSADGTILDVGDAVTQSVRIRQMQLMTVLKLSLI